MKSFGKFKSQWCLSSTSKLIAIITSLHLGFIILFDKVTAFAPDEANYIGVFNNLYRSDFSLDGYLGWQGGSISALRAIYLPAKILEVVGFADFYAVRILSVLYSMLSLYVLLKMTPHGKILRRSNRFWIASSYCVPSIFLWTSLGLRESFIIFSYIAIFYFFVNSQNFTFIVQFLLLAVVSTFLLISKSYLYILLLICLTTSAIFLALIRKQLKFGSLKLLSAFLIPIVLFPSVATNTVTAIRSGIEIDSNSFVPIPYPGGQTLNELNQQFDKNSVLSWLSSVTGVREMFEQRMDASHLLTSPQELSENFTRLQTQPASLQDPGSLLVGAFNFLFVPTPFLNNGSLFLNAQSYESFIWYFYYLILVFLLVGLIRGRYTLNLLTLSSSLFSLGFIAISAFTEINDGTSVRHRAILMTGILVMLATFQHKQPERLENQRTKSSS